MTATTYTADGYSPSCGAYVQGALAYTITGPAGLTSTAHELAWLIAAGYSRRAAGARLALEGSPATGLRVLRAELIQ